MKYIYLLILITFMLFTCGCTSTLPVEGVVINKYIVEPGYKTYYPTYYVVFQDDNGYSNVRQVNPDTYFNSELGHRYKWGLI